MLTVVQDFYNWRVFWLLICIGSCAFYFFIWITMSLVQCIKFFKRVSGFWSKFSNTKMAKVDACTPIGT